MFPRRAGLRAGGAGRGGGGGGGRVGGGPDGPLLAVEEEEVVLSPPVSSELSSTARGRKWLRSITAVDIYKGDGGCTRM